MTDDEIKKLCEAKYICSKMNLLVNVRVHLKVKMETSSQSD